MMLSVLSLARKCDGKAPVRHREMLSVQSLEEEKWKEERAQDIAVNQGKADASPDRR